MDMPTRRPAPAWDPPLTVALLVVGLYNATTSVAQVRDVASTLAQVYLQLDIGTYRPTDATQPIGWAIAIVEVLALVGAIWFSVLRLRSHRMSFWIPIAFGLASAAVTFGLWGALLLGDPTFTGSLTHLSTE